MNIKERLQPIFVMERVICRLIAAWCGFLSVILLREEQYASVSALSEISLGTVILWSGLLFVLLSAVSFLLSDYPTDSWFLMLWASVCVGRWIYLYPQGEQKLLVTLGVIAVYVLFVIYFLHQNAELLAKWNPDGKTVALLAAFFAVTAFVILSVITCLRYKTFVAPNYDFGLFCNMFENMRKTGLPLVTSERDGLLSHFAVHISPIFYLLLPFYYLFPSPMTLQIGQAAILMAGVIPVVLLARHYKLSPKMTVLLSFLYSFYPVLSTGCFYDIHENCFLPFFLLFTFYFFEKERYLPMYLCAIGVLAVKEDAAIYLLLFALFVIFSRKRLLHGTVLAAASVGYFLLATHLIQTYGDGLLSNRFENLVPDAESGVLGVVGVALTNPGFLITQLFTEADGGWDKVSYFIRMFLPLGFLPFCTRKVSRWLLIAPILINLLSYYPYLYDMGFQYHFGVAAFLVYAMIQNLSELSPTVRRNLISIAAAACCCLYLFSVFPALDGYVERWREGKEDYIRMDEILDTLPDDASLNVSTFLLAHVADHDEVYEVAYHNNVADVDFVVLDKRDGYQSTKHAYLAQGYTVFGDYDDLILILQRGGE